MVKEKDKRPICSKCGSKIIYVTKKELVCRRCGFREPKKEKKEGIIKEIKIKPEVDILNKTVNVISKLTHEMVGKGKGFLELTNEDKKMVEDIIRNSDINIEEVLHEIKNLGDFKNLKDKKKQEEKGTNEGDTK